MILAVFSYGLIAGFVLALVFIGKLTKKRTFITNPEAAKKSLSAMNGAGIFTRMKQEHPGLDITDVFKLASGRV